MNREFSGCGFGGVRLAVVLWAVLCAVPGLMPLGRADAGERTFSVNYAARPDARQLLAYDLAILAARTEADLAAGQRLGRRYLGYISVVEVADPEHRREAAASGLLTAAVNPVWKGAVADVAQPQWRAFVLDRLAKPLVERGFDGFFLDTADSVALIARDEAERDRYNKALVRIIRALRAAHPGREIILNRGFDLLEELGDSIDGVLIESVFRSYDFGGKAYIATAEADTKALLEHIRRIKAGGRAVYVLDYVPAGDRMLARETLARIADAGAHGYLASPALDGTTAGPLLFKAGKPLLPEGSPPAGKVKEGGPR